MSDLLQGLNEAQVLAVTTTEGPVMVMAGAGSGKTKVLTTRIAYIIKELGIVPSGILAVTFTNKAAGEMKERIANMLDIETKYMWISTFHSFAVKILRMEIDNIPPYKKGFTIIDEEDSLKIVKEIMKEKNIDSYKPKEIRNIISKSKNFYDYSVKDPLLNSCYLTVKRYYQERLKKENLMDFDDLIINVIELFENNLFILEKYQQKFQYILVDEFQDTNFLQYKLIRLLSAKYQNIFVVGDDFQSIYSFRGAKIENINHFRNDYKNTQLILLEKNYRSTTEILNLANSIIVHNPNQIKKVMYSNNKNGNKPIYYNANTAYDEAMYVIDTIKKGLLSGDKYSDFAILYRANYISRGYEDVLVRNNIPYKIYGGLSFFSRKEIKDMIAYLRLIIHNDDDFSFRRIINEPKRKIGDVTIKKLDDIKLINNCSLFEAIDYYEGSGAAANNLVRFKTVIDEIKTKVNEIQLPKIIDLILEKTGYEEALKQDEDTYLDRLENIKEFKSVLKEALDSYDEEKNNEGVLDALLTDLALRTDSDDVANDNCVRLSTFHQVKGLEFKNVIMVAMEEGIFPSMNSISNEEIEEERRVCYVGITRAKDNLYLTNAQSRFLFGNDSYMHPSRFIKEMNNEYYDDYFKLRRASIKKTVIPKEEPKKKEEITTNTSNFKVGDKINHKAFGDGLVVSVKGDIISVAFKAPHGIKTLKGSHPSIRKID